MSRQPLLKVYGHIYPVDDALYAALEKACADAMPDEGAYFPLDSVLEALTAHMQTGHQGKLDVLDMEDWRLIRHTFIQGRMDVHSAPLNNVLDYSGH